MRWGKVRDGRDVQMSGGGGGGVQEERGDETEDEGEVCAFASLASWRQGRRESARLSESEGGRVREGK